MQFGPAQVGLGLGQLGLRLLDLGLAVADLRLQRSDLSLACRQGRPGGADGCELRPQIGSGLLRGLDGARALAHEILRTRILVSREAQAGLRLLELVLGLIDLVFLHVDLRVRIGDACLRLLDLRLGLLHGGDVVARVDFRQQVADAHRLVVRNRNVDDVAGHFRAHGDWPAIDKGVVGDLEMARVEIPEQSSDQRRQQNDRTARGREPVAAQDWADSLSGAALVVGSIRVSLRPPGVFGRLRGIVPPGRFASGPTLSLARVFSWGPAGARVARGRVVSRLHRRAGLLGPLVHAASQV